MQHSNKESWLLGITMNLIFISHVFFICLLCSFTVQARKQGRTSSVIATEKQVVLGAKDMLTILSSRLEEKECSLLFRYLMMSTYTRNESTNGNGFLSPPAPPAVAVSREECFDKLKDWWLSASENSDTDSTKVTLNFRYCIS